MFRVTVMTGSIDTRKDQAIVVNLFEGVKKPGGATGAVDAALGGAIGALIASGDLTGKYREITVLPASVLAGSAPGRGKATKAKAGGGPAAKGKSGGVPSERVLVVGLGKKEDFSLDRARDVSAAVALRVRELGLKSYSTIVHGAGAGGLDHAAAAGAMAEGAAMALYTYTRFKTPGKDETRATIGKSNLPGAMTMVEREAGKAAALRKAVNEGLLSAAAVNRVRDLATTPGNELTPKDMEAHVKKAVRELKSSGVRDLKLTVLDEEDMKREGMGGLLGVSRGSVEPARMIILEYNRKRKGRPLVLVGKGITFDSGGISLKPTEGVFPMWEMKDDMTGAAIVLSTVIAAAALGMKTKLVAVAPCSENLPSGRALKPGDVIRACDGTTIEVHNTDAEGRLVLADGLAHSKKFGPSAIVDVATLTGSVWVALGSQAAGVFGNDQELIDALRGAGETAGERFWQLPLYDEYDKQIESEIADVKNVGGRPGGSITAAAFLKKFVPEGVPWIHLDIAGVSWNKGSPVFPDRKYYTKGSTGFGVRTLLELARTWKG